MNITNIQTHNLLTFDDLTDKEKKDFEYINDNEHDDFRFVRCFDGIFDIYEASSYLDKDWDAICHLTYDSGLLFRLSSDRKHVTVARFY